MKRKKRVFNLFSLILVAVIVIELLFISNFANIGNAVRNMVNPIEEYTIQKKISTTESYQFEKNREYDQIKISGYEYVNELGKPEMPFKKITLSIPMGQDVSDLQINYEDRVELNGDYQVFPVQPSEECCESRRFNHPDFIEPDLSVYGSEKPYPEDIVKISEEGYFQGHKLISFNVYPFQYFPKTKKIVYYKNPSFSLNFEKINEVPTSLSGSDSNEVVKSLVQNPEDVNTNIYNGGRTEKTIANYLIITSNSLVSTFQPLATHKQNKGLSTQILTTENIYSTYAGEDNQAKIRNAIIDYHQTKGTYWVLLGGDEEIIPIRYCYDLDTNTNLSLSWLQICDFYYSALDGNWDADGDGIYGEPNQDNPDFYPDVYLGRIPLHEPTKITNWINKLKNYETNPGNGVPYYLSKVAYVSSDQMRDYGTTGQHTILSENFPSVFNQNLVSMIEQPSGYAANPTQPLGQNVLNDLNQGYGFIFFLNHGRVDGFVVESSGYGSNPRSFVFTFTNTPSDGDLNLMNNYNKYGIVNSLSCDVGAFDAEHWVDPNVAPSPAETFLSLENKGAVSVIANSRFGWVATSWRIINEFLYRLFIDDSNKHIGELHVISKSYFTNYRDLLYGLNLYGDPEMIVYTCKEDNDGDGYTACQDDCNDNNANINPSKPEICDGIDNNCNGLVDGQELQESCGNGLDDDCDGLVDANDRPACDCVTNKFSCVKANPTCAGGTLKQGYWCPSGNTCCRICYKYYDKKCWCWKNSCENEAVS